MVDQFHLPSSVLFNYKDIDREHQNLIDILNRIYGAFGEDNEIRSLDVKAKVAELENAMAVHFGHEEQEMLDTGFPGLAAHRTHHAAALAKVVAIVTSVQSRQTVKRAVVTALFEPLLEELFRQDVKFKRFLDERNP